MKHLIKFNDKSSKNINEGFAGYTVVDSDTASDLLSDVEKAIVKVLKVGEKEENNSYNTHGTLNAAMILLEFFGKLIKTDSSSHIREYALKVSEKLKKESDAFLKNGDYEKEYCRECKEISKKLYKISQD